MAKVDNLRSGYAKVGALVFFGRMLDKIRLADRGELPPGYNLASVLEADEMLNRP
jgi:hypothetical protein